MAVTITYSLRPDSGRPDQYYRDVSTLADRLLAQARRVVGHVIDEYRDFRTAAGLPDRTFAECAFELLALGVLLREHGAQAARLPRWSAWLLTKLVEAQERFPTAERPIKAVRGLVSGLLEDRRAAGTRGHDVGRLVAWLSAHGQTAQAERLAEWRDYLGGVGPRAARKVVTRCLVLADAFALEGGYALGPYTREVERFLSDVAPKRRWRYDAELASRSRLEYHLGMVGAEILSRAYRERFLATRRRVVVLPTCMRARQDGACRATETPLGARCRGCTPGCAVRKVTALGEERGFDVFILPDNRRGYGARVCAKLEGVGVVGVACALTCWDAGWELDAAGVAAQGVLLDYVGCRSHWHERGVPTTVSLSRLEEAVASPAVAEPAVALS